MCIRDSVNTGCDDVEVDGVEWNASPEGLLSLVPKDEDCTTVDIKNIRWYPGEVESPCDRYMGTDQSHLNAPSQVYHSAYTVKSNKHSVFYQVKYPGYTYYSRKSHVQGCDSGMAGKEKSMNAKKI